MKKVYQNIIKLDTTNFENKISENYSENFDDKNDEFSSDDEPELTADEDE